MKRLYSLLSIAFTISTASYGQTFCSPDGDIVIFSNYDGGVLRINIDLPTPNLKIGIVSYEDDSVIISGAYAANVSRVVYAGYFNSDNIHCSPNIDVKGVYGVDTSIVDINFIPAATLSNPYGYLYIICNTSCVLNSSQGGCNTADQVEDYFFNQFGSNKLLFHRTQYGCWTGEQALSAGGNCCALTVNIPGAEMQQQVTVYPNPASDVLNVETSLAQSNEFTITDELGRIVMTGELSEVKTSVNISKLSAGVYLFRAGERRQSFTVVKR